MPEDRERDGLPGVKILEPLIQRCRNHTPAIECEHFIDCSRTNQRPLTDGRHGGMVVRILEAAQESIGRGGSAVRIES